MKGKKGKKGGRGRKRSGQVQGLDGGGGGGGREGETSRGELLTIGSRAGAGMASSRRPEEQGRKEKEGKKGGASKRVLP